jgi:UDP-glucose 4-epimerase
MKIAQGKFVITGGASLIGSHTADALLARGAREVVLLDNYSLGSPDVLGDLANDARVKVIRGDILQTRDLFDAFADTDGVFAIAGFLTLPMAQNAVLGLSVNVTGHANVMEVCRYRGVRRVVFASSTAVYGEPLPEPMAEDTAFNWAKFQPAAAMYSASKIIGENLCRHYHNLHGIESMSLRYGTVYGERQHYRGVNALYIMENYDRIRRGERPLIPGDGKEVHDYIHVSDVARANVMAMESDIAGESLNVVSGVATTLNEVISTLLRVMGSHLEPEFCTGKDLTRVSVGTHLAFDRQKIRRLLGWEPLVGLEEGIHRLASWCERHDTTAEAAQ